MRNCWHFKIISPGVRFRYQRGKTGEGNGADEVGSNASEQLGIESGSRSKHGRVNRALGERRNAVDFGQALVNHIVSEQWKRYKLPPPKMKSNEDRLPRPFHAIRQLPSKLDCRRWVSGCGQKQRG